MITTTQLKKAIFILTITTILILSAFLASAMIKVDAKKEGYYDFLYLSKLKSYDDSTNNIILENDLRLQSNKLMLSDGSIRLGVNSGRGTIPASYMYQGNYAGSTSKQFALAIHDSLWITRHAFIDNNIDVGGDMDSKGTISTEERLRIKNSDGSSKASIEWVDSYENGNPALLINSSFESSSSIGFQPGMDWNSRMVLDKNSNLNIRGDVEIEETMTATKFIADNGLTDVIHMKTPTGDTCTIVVEDGIITSFNC